VKNGAGPMHGGRKNCSCTRSTTPRARDTPSSPNRVIIHHGHILRREVCSTYPRGCGAVTALTRDADLLPERPPVFPDLKACAREASLPCRSAALKCVRVSELFVRICILVVDSASKAQHARVQCSRIPRHVTRRAIQVTEDARVRLVCAEQSSDCELCAPRGFPAHVIDARRDSIRFYPMALPVHWRFPEVAVLVEAFNSLLA
jgi:hypothetical protein